MVLLHQVGWEPKFLERNRWFWPLARASARFESQPDWPSLAEFNALYAELTLGKDVKPLRFGENVRKQDKRIAGRVNLDALYDARISQHGEVPSRERDWHDFFNALCFATFPRAKLALHTRQYTILRERVGHDAERLPGARTREQDALTLFDEGGVVVAADPLAHARLITLDREARRQCLLDLLETTPMRESFVMELVPKTTQQPAGKLAIVPFGHALFEHLIEGLRCPGGCTQWLQLPFVPTDRDELLSQIDQTLASLLTDRQRFTSPRDCAQVLLSLR